MALLRNEKEYGKRIPEIPEAWSKQQWADMLQDWLYVIDPQYLLDRPEKLGRADLAKLVQALYALGKQEK